MSEAAASVIRPSRLTLVPGGANDSSVTGDERTPRERLRDELNLALRQLDADDPLRVLVRVLLNSVLRELRLPRGGSGGR
jgi:hypothetical protein